MIRTLIAALLVMAGTAHASDANVAFYLSDPAERAAESVAGVALPVKRLFMVASGSGLMPGESTIRFVVFDANGKEVMNLTAPITVSASGRWRYVANRGFARTEPQGTWWVTVEVGGKPLATSSFEVKGG